MHWGEYQVPRYPGSRRIRSRTAQLYVWPPSRACAPACVGGVELKKRNGPKQRNNVEGAVLPGRGRQVRVLFLVGGLAKDAGIPAERSDCKHPSARCLHNAGADADVGLGSEAVGAGVDKQGRLGTAWYATCVGAGAAHHRGGNAKDMVTIKPESRVLGDDSELRNVVEGAHLSNMDE